MYAAFSDICFNTIQDDIDLKQMVALYYQYIRFNTIQDDIDLKLSYIY